MFENYRLLVQEVGQLTHYDFLRHLIGSTAQNCFHFHVARISDRFDTEKKWKIIWNYNGNHVYVRLIFSEVHEV